MAITTYKYRTFSKEALFSRLHFKTRIELPRPVVIINNNEITAPDSIEHQDNIAKKINEHGNVESIISRSESSTGRVIYEVLWQDGTKSQESVECIHSLAYDKFEGYEHKKFDLRRCTDLTTVNNSDGNSIDDDLVITRQQSRRRRRVQKKKTVQWATDEEDDEDGGDDQYFNGNNGHGIQDKENQRPFKKRRRIDTTHNMAVINVDDFKTRTGRFSQIPYYTDPEMIYTHWKQCTKCNEKGLPNGAQNKSNKNGKRRHQQEKMDDVFEMSSGEEELLQGRLLLCITCSAATHEGCISLGRSRKQHLQHLRSCRIDDDGDHAVMQFQCIYCLTATPDNLEEFPKCDGCHESHGIQRLKFFHHKKESEVSESVGYDNNVQQQEQRPKDASPHPPKNEDKHRLYRCNRCLRAYHDTCLPDYVTKNTDNMVDRKRQIFEEEWQCGECITYNKRVDLILTWRVRGTREVQDKNTGIVGLDYNKAKPSTREYLIKWVDTPYTHLDWVSDGWLKLIAKQKYKNFCERQQHMERQTVAEVVPKDYLTIERILTAKDTSGNVLTTESIHLVDKVYVKYRGLNYDSIYWDRPPKKDSDLYPSFCTAYENYLKACSVQPPVNMKQQVDLVRELATKENYGRHELKQQPDYIRGGTLMPHQLDGLNWLIFQWERAKGCVLADDMGLGKTIQIVTFLNFLLTKYDIYPFLVVVPLSTATNWLREFNKWAPDMVVSPYYGSAEARKRALKHEIFRGGSKTPCCHAIILTYESAMHDNGLFSSLDYWPALIVDEAQRLKNDSSQLFQKLLKNIKYDHPILMTGTPLQNNIRELINVMHFVDRDEFNDIKKLEQKYSELSHTTVQELHDQLKPYFLRRTKEVVLKNLPPKTEIIVPVSMSSLQKEVYKGILEQNLTSYAQLGSADQKVPSKMKTTTLRNTLMQLRKTLGHPYFIPDIEIKQKDAVTTHQVLIDSCAKLKILHQMLPKLKQNGHRVLIFSGFKGVLDILEDYLMYEQHNYVRVDGDVSSNDRVTAIDKYNGPESDIFVFLLTTRAGGVGINLATADTVIMWDFDFNPHADLQAICRAHRIGQTRPVLVLRFMTRLSVEEKIAQIAKKKMALDHLIVEKMDDDNLEEKDVEGIIKFGAQALFEADDSKRIIYDSVGIDKLLDRATEKDMDDNHNYEKENEKQSGAKPMSFSFAKVWVKDKGEAVDDLPVDGEEDRPEDEDFFIKYLERKRAQMEAEKQMKEQEQELGRGARKRAFVNYSLNTERKLEKVQTNKKNKKKKGSKKKEGNSDSEDSDFQLESIPESELEEEFEKNMEIKRAEIAAMASPPPNNTSAPCSQSNNNKESNPSKNIPESNPALIQAAFANLLTSLYRNKIGALPPQQSASSSSSQPRSQQRPPQWPYQEQQIDRVLDLPSHFSSASPPSTQSATGPQRRQQVQYYTADLTNTLLNISEQKRAVNRQIGSDEIMAGQRTITTTSTLPPQPPVRQLSYNGSNNHDYGNHTILHLPPQQSVSSSSTTTTTTDTLSSQPSSTAPSVNRQSYPLYTPPPSYNSYPLQLKHSQLTASSSSRSPPQHLQQSFSPYTLPPPQHQKQIPHFPMPIESRPNPTQSPNVLDQDILVQHNNNNNNNNNVHLNNIGGSQYNSSPQQNIPVQLSHPHHAIPLQQQHDHYHLSPNSPIQHQPFTPFGRSFQQYQHYQQPLSYAHNAQHGPTQYLPRPPPLSFSPFINQQQQQQPQSQAHPTVESPTLSSSTSRNQSFVDRNSR